MKRALWPRVPFLPRRHGIFIFIVWDLRRGKGWALFSVTSGPLSQSQIIFHFGVGDWDWKGKQEGPLERELRDDLSTPRDQGKISLERWELTVKSLRETLVTPLLRLETTSRWEQRCGQDVFLSSCTSSQHLILLWFRGSWYEDKIRPHLSSTTKQTLLYSGGREKEDICISSNARKERKKRCLSWCESCNLSSIFATNQLVTFPDGEDEN